LKNNIIYFLHIVAFDMRLD